MEVLDKLWCGDVERKVDFKAESETAPKVRAHQWYDNLCKSILEVADKVLPKKRSRKSPCRENSQRTLDLFKKLQRMTNSNSSKQQFR